MRKSLETYDPSDFVVGCTVDMGTWVVEIGNKLNIDDYASGRIFLQAPTIDILILFSSLPSQRRVQTLPSFLSCRQQAISTACEEGRRSEDLRGLLSPVSRVDRPLYANGRLLRHPAVIR